MVPVTYRPGQYFYLTATNNAVKPDTDWHHAVYVKEANTALLYIDGSLVAKRPDSVHDQGNYTAVGTGSRNAAETCAKGGPPLTVPIRCVQPLAPTRKPTPFFAAMLPWPASSAAPSPRQR